MKAAREVHYQVVCPNCGVRSNITVENSWRYWIADAEWVCPKCKGVLLLLNFNITKKPPQKENE